MSSYAEAPRKSASGTSGASALFREASAQYANGQIDEAESTVAKALRVNPHHVKSLILKGVIHNARERYDKAIEKFDAALRLQPTNGLAYGNRGIARRNKGLTREALSDFDRALDILGSDVSFLKHRAVAHRVLQQYTQALDDYNLAISLAPNSAELLYHRSRVYMRINEPECRLADLVDALKLEPNNKTYRAAFLEASAALDDDEPTVGNMSSIDSGSSFISPLPNAAAMTQYDAGATHPRRHSSLQPSVSAGLVSSAGFFVSDDMDEMRTSSPRSTHSRSLHGSRGNSSNNSASNTSDRLVSPRGDRLASPRADRISSPRLERLASPRSRQPPPSEYDVHPSSRHSTEAHASLRRSVDPVMQPPISYAKRVELPTQVGQAADSESDSESEEKPPSRRGSAQQPPQQQQQRAAPAPAPQVSRKLAHTAPMTRVETDSSDSDPELQPSMASAPQMQRAKPDTRLPLRRTSSGSPRSIVSPRTIASGSSPRSPRTDDDYAECSRDPLPLSPQRVGTGQIDFNSTFATLPIHTNKYGRVASPGQTQVLSPRTADPAEYGYMPHLGTGTISMSQSTMEKAGLVSVQPERPISSAEYDAIRAPVAATSRSASGGKASTLVSVKPDIASNDEYDMLVSKSTTASMSTSKSTASLVTVRPLKPTTDDEYAVLVANQRR